MRYYTKRGGSESDHDTHEGIGHLVLHFTRILLTLNQPRWSFVNIIFLLFLSVLEELLIFQIGLITAKFYYILLIRDLNKFYWQLLTTLGLILFMSLIKSAKTYATTVIYIEWREHLSKLLINDYFKELNYYHLNMSSSESTKKLNVMPNWPVLDNLDQRLSHDVDRLCSECSLIISQLVISPLTIVYYSYQVSHTIGFFGVVSCFAVFLFSTGVNRFFLGSIIHWTYLKGKHEGIYRTEHCNIKNTCEAIAFASAESKVKLGLFKLLQQLLSIYENLALHQFYLNFLTTIFDYSGTIVSFIVIAIPLFSGDFDHLNKAELSRQISTNTFICLYLINCFTKIVGITSNFATINGIGLRITELMGAFAVAHKRMHFLLAHPAPLIEPHSELYLQVNEVSIAHPDDSNRSILTKLSFTVRRGENLYITGESGLGKTSILRAIKGLWPVTSGTITCPLDLNDVRQVMFISQNSTFAHYYLEEIASNRDSSQALAAYLAHYSIDALLSDASLDGSTSAILQCQSSQLENLSPGQLQILNFLIAFIFQPKLLFVDDATSSLSEQVIDQLYHECQVLQITVVTIANSDVFLRHHLHSFAINKPTC